MLSTLRGMAEMAQGIAAVFFSNPSSLYLDIMNSPLGNSAMDCQEAVKSTHMLCTAHNAHTNTWPA